MAELATLSGTIVADGSSTVWPFTAEAAERFAALADVATEIEISGAGGGFREPGAPRRHAGVRIGRVMPVIVANALALVPFAHSKTPTSPGLTPAPSAFARPSASGIAPVRVWRTYTLPLVCQDVNTLFTLLAKLLPVTAKAFPR